MQQWFGCATGGDLRMRLSRRDQDRQDQAARRFVILLRLLHRKISRYFVTECPNHSIYEGIKELAKAGRREERPSSGKNIAARRAKAGEISGLFAF